MKYIKMIAIMLVAMMMFSVLFTFNNVYAATVTPQMIVEKFNKSSLIEEYKKMNGNAKATYDDKKIKVDIDLMNKKSHLEFLVDKDIMSVELTGETNNEEDISKIFMFTYMIDIVGQLHGYEEGAIDSTLYDERIKTYTLEKEGIDIKDKYIKLDISKKIPLLDFDNTYIEIKDLERAKKYIAGDGSYQKPKGNIFLYKYGFDGKNTILIAEKEDFTDNSYKSLISVLRVMFDNNEKVIENFKKNFPNMKSGNKEFSGFKIEINPKNITEIEKDVLPDWKNYKFVKITVDKNVAISGDKGNITPNKENPKKETDDKIDTLPRTGKEVNVYLISLYAIAGVALIGLVTLKRKKK